MENQQGFANFPELQPKPKQSKVKRILRLVKRFWYVVLAIVLVIAGLVIFQRVQASKEESWKRATDYYTRADYENAAKELKGLDMPSSPERLQVYAQAMLATRQLDKALAGYQKLYETKKDPSIKIIIGNIYNDQKQTDKAAGIYEEVIDANPTFVQAYVNLSTLYKLQGKKTDAIAVATKGVSNNPGSVTLLELRVSMLLDDKSNPAYRESVEALRKANPNDPLLEAIKE